MKGCIVYFSATGNTEYVANDIRDEFEHKGIKCDIFEVTKKADFNDNYDFYVFGAPIHAELFPAFYTEWVKKNITKGSGRKCIVFSTQASKSACGPAVMSDDLRKQGFEVVIEECIFLPNNYYTVMYKKFSEDESKELLKKSKAKVEIIVDKFLKNETFYNSARGRMLFSKLLFKLFMAGTKKWAKNSLAVDKVKCTRCGLCQQYCPVNNIFVDTNGVSFHNNCVSCQKCIHKCPANAFLYKNKAIDQYKLPSLET